MYRGFTLIEAGVLLVMMAVVTIIVVGAVTTLRSGGTVMQMLNEPMYQFDGPDNTRCFSYDRAHITCLPKEQKP